MALATRFRFELAKADPLSSTITSSFSATLEDGSTETYRDRLYFPGTTPAMWESIPPETLAGFCEAFTLMCGINYWKIHPTRYIELSGFGLTHEQALFWNDLYTKGLGEFFYRAQIDFRGLIGFPYRRRGRDRVVVPHVRRDRVLLAQGGGKDSIVSAEILRSHGVPFDSFVVGEHRLRERVIDAIGKPLVRVMRVVDPKLTDLRRDRKIHSGYPSVATHMLLAVFAAQLLDYRYAVFSNEQSADIPNLSYLGLAVNHQWSKSTECELMIRSYLERYVTKDVVPFSLLHQYSEAWIARKFAELPRYFGVFSSCNDNFSEPDEDPDIDGIAGWCNRCAKCAFIFACMSAFLDKKAVMGMFGANLYADHALEPVFRQLLGLDGVKPFECVGTPEEMRVLMDIAERTGSYDADPIMRLFRREAAIPGADRAAMQTAVFAAHGPGTIPPGFAERWIRGGIDGSKQPFRARLLHFFGR